MRIGGYFSIFQLTRRYAIMGSSGQINRKHGGVVMSVKNDCPCSPTPDDWAFLVKKRQPWNGMLADVLEQHGIPFVQKGNMGAGLAMSIGPLLEEFLFFVPQRYLQEAKTIVDALFPEE